MPLRLVGIGDGLSEVQRNAISIMSNLPPERFSKLKKDFLKFDEMQDVLDVSTLSKFLELAIQRGLDLSNEGIVRFKDIHLPGGNRGVLRGVIGKDTANRYYDELLISDGITFPTSYTKNELISHLNEIRTRGYESIIMEAAEDFDIQPSFIGGIGSRESFWGLILSPPGPSGTGDLGNGRGLLQIDIGSHEFARTGNWRDPRENIRYGCDLLADNRAALKKEGLKGRQLLKATAASYNAGLGRVLRKLDQGVDVDLATTGNDYGKDVIDRAGWFQKFAGWL
jgi:hypothetical protein